MAGETVDEQNIFCFNARFQPQVLGSFITFLNWWCLFNTENKTFLPLMISVKGKGKAVPLQAYSGPEGSRKLRFSDYMTTAQDGGKVVSLTHWSPLPPGNAPGTRFC
jgi:hypothetical protein